MDDLDGDDIAVVCVCGAEPEDSFVEHDDECPVSIALRALRSRVVPKAQEPA